MNFTRKRSGNETWTWSGPDQSGNFVLPSEIVGESALVFLRECIAYIDFKNQNPRNDGKFVTLLYFESNIISEGNDYEIEWIFFFFPFIKSKSMPRALSLVGTAFEFRKRFSLSLNFKMNLYIFFFFFSLFFSFQEKIIIDNLVILVKL